MSPIRAALVLLFVVACRNSDARVATPPAHVSVRTAPVVLASLDEPAVAAGVVAAHDEFPLAFKIGGVVASVSVREGDLVRAGQTLAQLDLREIDAQVARARSAVAKAERDHARAKALHADSLAPLAQLQDAATALELARADLQTAAVNRRYATVVAPSAGRVLRRTAEPGQTLSSGAPVLVVGGTTGGTVLRVGLADRDVVRVRVGSPATVRLDAFPGRVITGHVRQIAGAATPGTGTYAVEVALDDATGLSAGLIGSASIVAAGRGSLPTVPVDALLEADGDRASVFVVAGDRARRRAVRVATVQGDRVAVREGLDGVSSVVVTGAPYLTDGATVRVLP
ncbi:MAG TPA: efflux RND transporter periplasmic adaptor subunit [Gemmatimonadaceae bacterium]|nr:efflux RND transporter periplasmic adaptor subunit [Gemmatimonadaceae bacterium]